MIPDESIGSTCRSRRVRRGGSLGEISEGGLPGLPGPHPPRRDRRGTAELHRQRRRGPTRPRLRPKRRVARARPRSGGQPNLGRLQGVHAAGVRRGPGLRFPRAARALRERPTRQRGPRGPGGPRRSPGRGEGSGADGRAPGLAQRQARKQLGIPSLLREDFQREGEGPVRGAAEGRRGGEGRRDTQGMER